MFPISPSPHTPPIPHLTSSHIITCSVPILKVQLTVESKLAVTMLFRSSEHAAEADADADTGAGDAVQTQGKVTCDVDMALQDERWYHVSIAVHPAEPMAVFLNGVQIKYYCVENVSKACTTQHNTAVTQHNTAVTQHVILCTVLLLNSCCASYC